jgi:hypothetical protein
LILRIKRAAIDGKEWREDMYGVEGKSKVSEVLQQFRNAVEARCRPVVKGALK